MDEYIKRESLLSIVKPDVPGDENKAITISTAKTLIRSLAYRVPVADVAPVVHAEWVDIVFDPMWRSMKATCSHCMVRGEVRVKGNECGFAVPDSDFCPSCGAKMDFRRRDDGT